MHPTGYSYCVLARCYEAFQIIKKNETLKQKFLASTANLDLFVAIMDLIFETDIDSEDSLIQTKLCQRNHPILWNFIRRSFHCFIKNLVKELSATHNPTSLKAKATKLSSQS